MCSSFDKKMKALATLAAILFLTNGLQAHSDTLIELKGKSLVGLPERFQPAAFDSERASLTIAGKELLLPRFLTSVLADKEAYELQLASSWYHDPELLPPYISIDVTPKGRHFTYSVLVDMVGMKILEVEVELKETDSVTRLIPVDPAFWRDGKGGGTITTYRSPKEVEQGGTGQPATRPDSKPEGGDKPQPEAKGRSR
jgi:hypothetical protein